MSSCDALKILRRVEQHTSAPIQIRSDAARIVDRFVRYVFCIFMGALSIWLFWWAFSPDTARAWVFTLILGIIAGWFGGAALVLIWRALPNQYALRSMIYSCMGLLGRAPVMTATMAYGLK